MRVSRSSNLRRKIQKGKMGRVQNKNYSLSRENLYPENKNLSALIETVEIHPVVRTEMVYALNGFSLPPRSERLKESILIDGQQTTILRAFEILLTSIGWGTLLSLLLQFPLTLLLWFFKIYSVKNLLFIDFNAETIQTIHNTLVMSYIFAFLIGAWTIYNQSKYGKLKRRKFKPDVSNEELKEYFQIDDETLTKLKEEKYIILKDTFI